MSGELKDMGFKFEIDQPAGPKLPRPMLLAQVCVAPSRRASLRRHGQRLRDCVASEEHPK